MERETISKNRVSPKNAGVGRNLTRLKLALFVVLFLFSAISGFSQNFTENFEGDVSAWTLVNGAQTNNWVIGSATACEGSKSAYISNDGTANAYGNTASIVHLYRDVELGVNSTLTFFWKGQGESGYDELKVYLIPTSTWPTAGSQLPDNDGYGNIYLLGTFSESASWKQETIDLPAYSSTKRLVFSWRNDNSSAVQPPVAIDNVVLTTTGNGIGTANNPYLISSKANMEALALTVANGNDCSGIYFSLTRDLTGANDTVTTVIGGDYPHSFKGVFDGGGHEVAVKIATIEPKYQLNAYAGVFGYISNATIKNLGVSGSVSSYANSSSYSSSYSGGICGYASSSSITNCYNTGSVSSKNSYRPLAFPNDAHSGGICGIVVSSTITNCYNIGSVSSSTASTCYSGGIYGSQYSSYSSTIMNCYNTGSVSSSSSSSSSYYYNSYSGGICGENGTISNCFAANTTIQTQSYSTAQAQSSGRIAYSAVSISNCYALSSMTVNGSTIDGSPTSSSLDGKSQSLATFQSQSWIEETLGWDFTNIWKMSASNSIYGGLPIFKNQQDITTNIENIVANKTENFKIYSAPNGIALEAKEVTPVSIFNIAGQKVHQSVVNGSATISLNKGVYIVSVGSESQKVIVK
ncbi:hypothetical protein AGMMS50262_21170 [Bacteroidia bacterium]|nr:hypothetical protein AGMMS50262_21170 [Bacteroidia bacterium]